MHNRLGLMRYKQLERAISSSTDHNEVDRILKDLRSMLLYQTAVEANIFGHLKFFDPSLPEDHVDNYYMEREWRVNGRVDFRLEDIRRVLVPPEFIQAMADELPELGASITPLAAG
jgi:hypothetical protein